MARMPSRAALQERADIIEDETGAAARIMFRGVALALGQPLDKIEAIIKGPEAEFALLQFRTGLEPVIRRAVDRGIASGRRRL